MMKLLDGKRLILASNSPRRKELLGGLDVDFDVRVLNGIDESFPETLAGEDIPKYISQQKAKAYIPSLAADEVLVTSDTIVYLDGEVLGKPKDADDARRMLRLISGRSHDVITGVTIVSGIKINSFSVTTKVTFKQLSDDIVKYIDDVYEDKTGSVFHDGSCNAVQYVSGTDSIF